MRSYNNWKLVQYPGIRNNTSIYSNHYSNTKSKGYNYIFVPYDIKGTLPDMVLEYLKI